MTGQGPYLDSTHEEVSASQPPLGHHCTDDGPYDALLQPSGEIIKIGTFEAYVSKPANYETAKLLLFLSNAVGIYGVHNQVQADHFAKEGFMVVMPDLFEGDPAPKAGEVTISKEEADKMGFVEKFKLATIEGVKGYLIEMWLARHTEEKTMPILDKVVDVIKEAYPEQAQHGTYTVGYCFGGKYVLKLAATEKITAGAVAHSTLVTASDIKGVKKPISFVSVENDLFFPDDVREQGIKYLRENNIEHEDKIYKGVSHGFAVVGSYKEEIAVSSQKLAYEQMLQWLLNH